MSNTVPSQHPAVVLRSSRQHLRALLAIAIAFIVGLSIAVAVAVFANRADRSIPATLASPAPPSPIPAHPSAQTGAKLEHSGRKAALAHTSDRLANYPDTPPASAGSPQPSISYYLNPPQP